MSKAREDEQLTVLYDGACPLCRREILHVKNLAQHRPESGLCFLDLSRMDAEPLLPSTERSMLLARFHVQRPDGSKISGAAAFVAMWRRLPGWRWLAKLSDLPGMLVLMEWVYRAFLRVRPALQAIARRLDKSK
ncbi:MAG: DUF393 domain-containing protein [Gammaproteobacteria bacterium]|nr:DUF393 domain-containing protein [Gammaproteobacteria bacterium]